MQIYTKNWKTDGQMTLIGAIGPKMCKKAMPVYIRSHGIEKMQIQILICYTKVNQSLNSNVCIQYSNCRTVNIHDRKCMLRWWLLLFAALGKAEPIISTAARKRFGLDPWLWPRPLTLTPTFDLDLHTEYQGRRSNGSGVRALTDRRMDGRYQVHYLPRFAVDKYWMIKCT